MQGNKITGLEYKLCEECKKERVKFSVNILETTLSFSFFSPDLSFLKLFFLSYLGLPARGDDGENASSIIAKNSLASITAS